MARFGSPCSQFTSWINITCLEGGFVLLHLCIPLLLTLPSQLMHFVHRLPAPHLQRLRSRRWSEAWQTCRVENTAVTRCPLCAPVTLMTDTHWSPPLYCAPPSLLSALWGSELNADNMSSSVHLTLPVKVLAMSSILMQSIPFIMPYKKTLGAGKTRLWQKLSVRHFCRSKRNISANVPKKTATQRKDKLLFYCMKAVYTALHLRF